MTWHVCGIFFLRFKCFPISTFILHFISEKKKRYFLCLYFVLISFLIIWFRLLQFYLFPPNIRIRAQLHFIVIGFGIRLVAFLLSFCSQLMANLRLLISSQARAAKWSCVINQVFTQRCSTNPSFSSIKSSLPDSIVKTRVS